MKNRTRHKVFLRDSFYSVPVYAARFEINEHGQVIFYDAYDSIITIFNCRVVKGVEVETDYDPEKSVWFVVWDVDACKKLEIPMTKEIAKIYEPIFK